MSPAPRHPRPARPAAPDPGLQSWLTVVRAYWLCDAVLTQRLAPLGLKVGEHEVLVNLLRLPGLSQQELARRCFVAKSGISMLVTRMEEQGLLRREPDPADARVRRLLLTPAGQTLAQQALAVQQGVVQAMTEPASAAELAAVTEVMQRVAARLEQLQGGG